MATEEGVVVHAAHEVSDAFIEQYFQILRQKPQDAVRFYVDSSVVSRPKPDGTILSFTSLEAINEHILSCDYDENTVFEVLSVDSQYSVEDGIVIMVVGFFTGKDNLKRKFSQLFFLARQNSTYVVLNDIFRYVDEAVSTSVEQPVVESVLETEMAKSAGVVHKISVENSEATPPLDNGKNEHSDEKSVSIPKPKEPVVVETAAPQPDGGKKSFVAVVQSMATNDAPFQVKTPVQKPRYARQPRASAAPQAPSSVTKSEKKTEHKIIDEPGTSIFVANLPMNAVPPQLHELFQEFGPIKENGIQVRSVRAREACFGFVAFESATSVQNVLQAAKNNPFMLGDRKLRVKEKQVEYDGNKPTGRSGGGGSKAQNGSAEGGDELRRNRNRRNVGRTERRGERNDNTKKSSEGGAPDAQ